MRGLVIRSASILAGALVVCLGGPLEVHGQEFDGTCTYRGSEEDLANRLSPLDSATVKLGGDLVKLCYGQPSARDREIFGALVPFGELWRLGANEATRIDLPFSAELGSLKLDPGRYSLYVRPTPEEWEFFVSRAASRWGVPITDEVRAQEVGSFTVPVRSAGESVETFTISFEREDSRTARMELEWVDTRVVVPLRRTDP